jgi:hypothetical protein
MPSSRINLEHTDAFAKLLAGGEPDDTYERMATRADE